MRLPADAAAALRRAALDTPRALHLLAAEYSANAYPFSLRYQNCNQWVMELLAMAWGDLADGDELRARAQDWLRGADYAPEPVAVGSRLLMLASAFIPFLHLDDHPAADRDAMLLRVSLPSTVEAFVRAAPAGSERVELCHDGRQVVVHRGWTPIAAGCKPADGDRVVPLRLRTGGGRAQATARLAQRYAITFDRYMPSCLAHRDRICLAIRACSFRGDKS